MASQSAELAMGELKQIDIIKLYGQQRCLVVDDMPEVRGSLLRILRNFGANDVETAANGDEAVKRCQERTFDLVLCDYNLGAGKDGQQVLEEVRHTKALPLTSLFIMLTGESSREMVLGAIECQPDDYITKPFTEGSLRSRLDRALLRHQLLVPSKQALEQGQPQAALDACRRAQDNPGRHAQALQKLEGQLLLEVGDAATALTRFDAAAAGGASAWAALGRARALISLGDLTRAEQELLSLIETDVRLIEAHDLLTQIYRSRGEWQSAQRASEKAVAVSPKSARRHRALAALAEINGANDVAAKAHMQAARWGLNSCHESAQDYFNFARKSADAIGQEKSVDARRALAKQAHEYLARAAKRYPQKPDLNVQAELVRAQLAAVEGRGAEAAAALERAQSQFANLGVKGAEVVIELARALTAFGREDEARQHLTELAMRSKGDDTLLRQLDGITSEPISDGGRVIAAELTRKGIKAYSDGDYRAAIEVFNAALTSYPRHVSLNLNLLQSILAATQRQGVSADYSRLCQRSFNVIGELPDDHAEAARAQLIARELAKFYPEISR